VATRTLSWSGPKGGEIGIGFDDEHFGLGDMRGEIERMEDAYPNLPNEVPQGTSFVFSETARVTWLLDSGWAIPSTGT
jgi:hypothetical protein